MQRAIDDVNRLNGERGLPSVEMGIGIATGDVIVGNLGSGKRSKHTAMGSAVNLASRIEGHTLGGEVLLSQATYDEVAELVDVDRVRQVWPIGFEAPQQVHRVTAIHGIHELLVPSARTDFITLREPIAVRFSILEGKSVSAQTYDGRLTALSSTGARLTSEVDVAELTELRIETVDGAEADGVSYAKVVDQDTDDESVLTVRFSIRSIGLGERAKLEKVVP